jgi:hypothetical protein
VLLTRSLDSLHIIDFNPYLPRTDALLFTYEELLELLLARLRVSNDTIHGPPEFRAIGSRMHPSAVRASPAHQHNMIPRDALELSAGRDIAEFAQIWQSELARATAESDDE